MSNPNFFWERPKVAPVAPIEAPASGCNAPTQCSRCPTMDPDVLLGICARCFEERKTTRLAP